MPRPVFDALKGIPRRLYRGVNSPTDQEIFTKLGVGPVWHVVKALRDNSAIVLSDGALNSLRARLDRCNPLGAPALTTSPLGARSALLAAFDTSSEVATNHLATVEHVHWEESIQSPTAARYLESTTKDPKIAILYAYGAEIDSVLSGGVITFYQGQPNATPQIVLLEAGVPDALATASALAPKAQVARGRIVRDAEVLIQGRVAKLAASVPLPEFDIADPDRSLDAAAAALIAAQLAN